MTSKQEERELLIYATQSPGDRPQETKTNMMGHILADLMVLYEVNSPYSLEENPDVWSGCARFCTCLRLLCRPTHAFVKVSPRTQRA